MGLISERPGYLQKCLEAYPELVKKKYGVEFDLTAVEQKVRHLRRSTPLTYQDLAYFESPEHWWFRRFWAFPPEDRIAPALEGRTFDFWNLSGGKEESLVRELLYVFKSIELVSIMLRFIRPGEFAIFSSPVQHLLNIRRGRDPLETYLNYLRDVRDIRDHYGFARVADADMALWVLHEKCFGVHRDPAIEQACHEDTFILRMRAKNLVAPLSDLTDAQLANALTEVKPDLAALIACYTFEILIRKLAAHYGIAPHDANYPLEKVIEELPNYGSIDVLRKGRWNALRDLRNQLFHAGRRPGFKERSILVEEVGLLEKELESGAFMAKNRAVGSQASIVHPGMQQA